MAAREFLAGLQGSTVKAVRVDRTVCLLRGRPRGHPRAVARPGWSGCRVRTGVTAITSTSKSAPWGTSPGCGPRRRAARVGRRQSSARSPSEIEDRRPVRHPAPGPRRSWASDTDEVNSMKRVSDPSRRSPCSGVLAARRRGGHAKASRLLSGTRRATTPRMRIPLLGVARFAVKFVRPPAKTFSSRLRGPTSAARGRALEEVMRGAFPKAWRRVQCSRAGARLHLRQERGQGPRDLPRRLRGREAVASRPGQPGDA